MDAEPRLGVLPSVGQIVDRYQVVAEVAHGGMAAVYAARRTVGGFDKLLALKVMLPHLVGEEQFVEMFMDEARIASQLQHPNVVPVFDVGKLANTPYMVMEFLRGRSLGAVLRAPEPLAVGGLLAVVAQAADGLHAAHTARDLAGEPLGIVHRDVSPQNVHVGYDGHVRVVDFGIAAARGRLTHTRTGEVKGKLAYMAPEQLRGDAIDHRVDVWALGVLLYEALAGERLFRGKTDPETMWNVLNREVPPLDERVPALPPSIVDLVEACLARTPHDRPGSAQEVASVLRASDIELFDAARLGAFMEASFGAEREAEEQRLSALSVASARASAEGDPSVTIDAVNTVPARRSWLAGAALLGVMALGGAGYLLASGQPAETDPGAPHVATPPAETAVERDDDRRSAARNADDPSASGAGVEPVDTNVDLVAAGVSRPDVDGDSTNERAGEANDRDVARESPRRRRPRRTPRAHRPPESSAADPALMDVPL